MEPLKNSIVNSPTILSGISHEMRTHMNAIVSFSFLMKENSCNSSDREEFSNHIFSSCEQLIHLFDGFLDLAKIDSGVSKVKSKICRIDNMFDDLIIEFREAIKKEGFPSIELHFDLNISKPAEVYIDQNMIFRVIRCLFHNSIKNTETGYIKIGFSFQDEKLTIYILDSGNGYVKCKEFIDSRDINESLILYNDTYTAININLARKLLEILNGSIWIEPNDISGTGIYFSIPVKMTDNSVTYSNKLKQSTHVI